VRSGGNRRSETVRQIRRDVPVSILIACAFGCVREPRIESATPRADGPAPAAFVQEGLDPSTARFIGEKLEQARIWSELDGEAAPRTTAVAGGARSVMGKVRREQLRARVHAVRDALGWLARHQEPDGRWDADKHGGTNADAMVTGLALLAFLGTGNTEKAGRYSGVARKAVRWLTSAQAEDGLIGRGFDGRLGLTHGICGCALSEAYYAARVARTGEAAQRAVDYSFRVQQTDTGGWADLPRGATSLDVTAWHVLQVKSATVAGCCVPGQALREALRFVDGVTVRDGEGLGRCSDRPGGKATPTSTAFGIVCRLVAGEKRHSPLIQSAARHIRQHPHRWGEAGAEADFRYAYFGTMASFNIGHETWRQWMRAMNESLVAHQRGDGDEKGSWDPVGPGSDVGGRVFATALGALSMETYYRYVPKGCSGRGDLLDLPEDPDLNGSWDPMGGSSEATGRVGSTAMAAMCLEVYYRYLPLYR
jgi:hypothetical protein